MKICLITARNLYATACLYRYEKILSGTDYDIIYWDRVNIIENCSAKNAYRYYYPKNLVSSLLSIPSKINGYVGFRKFANRLICSNKYDKLIVLPTQAGILLFDLLTRQYAGRYIYDIRDYTAENNKIFYYLQKKLIGKSGLTTITSPGYRKFLPQFNYIISHNVPFIPESIIRDYRRKRGKEGPKTPIVISCIGGIRFIEQFKKVIRVFSNDERFVLRFIGIGSDQLQSYCESNKYTNIELIGRFPPEDTVKYYLESDFIMNLYGNHTPLLDYALSNKLYYAATLGMPILVCPDTYMEEVSKSYGFGFTFDLDCSESKDALWDYYVSINWPQLFNNCDSFMQQVLEEEQLFQKSVIDFLH